MGHTQSGQREIMEHTKIQLVELKDGKTLIKVRPENPKYRVLLSIDGGGIRGIIPAVVLQGFEDIVKDVAREVSPECRQIDKENLVVDIQDCFDVISGNSAGSLLALYIASGGGRRELYDTNGQLHGFRPGSMEAAVKIVGEISPEVFKLPRFSPKRLPLVRKLVGALYTMYGNEGLASVLEKAFGNLTLEDLKMNTFIPAYELNSARPVGFYSCELIGQDGRSSGYAYPKDVRPRKLVSRENRQLTSTEGHPHLFFEKRLANLPVRVAAQASSSAPVFFKAATFQQENLGDALGFEGDEGRWVDGGVVSNTPTVQALTFMATIYADKKTKEMLKMDRMAVLSLGTGIRKTPLSLTGSRQGLLEWGTGLIEVLMNSHNEVNHRIIDAMFDGAMFGVPAEFDRHVRINRIATPGHPDYETLGSLDSIEKRKELMAVGDSLLDEFREDMVDFVKFVLLAPMD